jgi:putative colanic acid biosynthesis UDP-glucose lipid carrier transferase
MQPFWPLHFLLSTYFFNQPGYQGLEWITLASLVFLWMFIGYLTNLYSRNLHNGFLPRLISYAKSYVIFAVFVIALVLLFIQFPQAFENAILIFVIGFLILNLFANSILVSVISRFRRNRRNTTYTLVAGVGDLAARTSNYFNSNPDYGYKIKGYLKCNGEVCKVNEKKIVGTVDDMKSFLDKNPIDEIIIALPYESPRSKVKEIIQAADFQGVRISYVPDYEGLLGNNFKIVHDGDLDAVNVHTMPQDEVYATLEKGFFDLIFSAAVLIFLSPVFLIITILIKLDSRGPVFYCPVRVGRGGKSFTVFKFRTMHTNDAALGGTQSTRKDDPRITRIGRKLRKYNLDELPQFLNVFLGDMSVVGPRPHRHFLNQQMKEHVDKYMIRHYFRPGVTGWAQVNGWRGPTETEEQISQRTAHDLWYIENWSIMLDLKIIWMTIFSPKARQNAF